MPDRCLRCEFHVPEICDTRSAGRCSAARLGCETELLRDEDLIRRHRLEKQGGHPYVSFGLLFERHHRHVVAWACRISGNYELALDLAQDVFVKVFTRLEAFRADSRFTTWLYSVTRNCFRDYVKARAARPREVGGESLMTVAPVTTNAAVAELEAQSARRLVTSLVRDARLDDLELRAFAMHYRDDMPLSEITAALGLTNTSGAKAPIVSARRKLRAAAIRWSRHEQTELSVASPRGKFPNSSPCLF